MPPHCSTVMREERNTIQRNLNRQEVGPSSLMKLNKSTHRLLHLSWGNPRDLGFLVDEKLDMSQQYTLASQKVNYVLGFFKRSVASHEREVLLTVLLHLCIHHLEHCRQLWDPQNKKDVEMLE